MYWLKILVACIGCPYYFWRSVSIVLRSPSLWNLFAVAYILVACIILYALYNQKQMWAKQLAELNSKHDRLVFTDSGMNSETLGGATVFLPWRSFKGWREGRKVMLLDTCTGSPIILPITNFSEEERQSIRLFIQSHIHAESSEASLIRAGIDPQGGNPSGKTFYELPRQNDVSPKANTAVDAVPRRSALEFTSQLTEAEFREFEKITRSIIFLLGHLIASILWLGMFWAFIGTDLISTHSHWGRDVIVFGILVGGYLWYLTDLKNTWTQRLARVNASMNRFILTDEGVEWHGSSGKTGLLPWSGFHGWREGRQVMVLEGSTIKFVILPVINLSEFERQSIRQFLQSHVLSARSQASSDLLANS